MKLFTATLILILVSSTAAAQALPIGSKEANQMQGVGAPDVLLPTAPSVKAPTCGACTTDHSWNEANALVTLYTSLGMTVTASVIGAVYTGYVTESRPAGVVVGTFSATTGLLMSLLFSQSIGHKSDTAWASALGVAISIALPFLLGYGLQ